MTDQYMVVMPITAGGSMNYIEPILFVYQCTDGSYLHWPKDRIKILRNLARTGGHKRVDWRKIIREVIARQKSCSIKAIVDMYTVVSASGYPEKVPVTEDMTIYCKKPPRQE